MKLKTANKIIKNQTYCDTLRLIGEYERDRIFCRHGMEHFLSVARIAVILCNERRIDVSPDLIYSAALLHDIGRARQYECGEPHDTAGERLAGEILREVGADGDFTETVCSCIRAHRSDGKTDFERIFYEADKRSRSCFCCAAQAECNWRDEKRNMEIEI